MFIDWAKKALFKKMGIFYIRGLPAAYGPDIGLDQSAQDWGISTQFNSPKFCCQFQLVLGLGCLDSNSK